MIDRPAPTSRPPRSPTALAIRPGRLTNQPITEATPPAMLAAISFAELPRLLTQRMASAMAEPMILCQIPADLNHVLEPIDHATEGISHVIEDVPDDLHDVVEHSDQGHEADNHHGRRSGQGDAADDQGSEGHEHDADDDPDDREQDLADIGELLRVGWM
jgi:hypothetical protein